MKKFCYILLMAAVLPMVSCKDNTAINMGEVSFYPSFLWCEAKMDTLVKTYDFEFSKDAVADSCFAEFMFVDNDTIPISQDELTVYVDGAKTEKNSFQVNFNETSKELKFAFNEQAKSGKHQGYLKLVNHNLDRIDNKPLQDNEQTVVIQWTIHFDKRQNPLAKGLMWTCIVIVIALLLWFAVLRSVFYPSFCKMSKTVLIKQNGEIKTQSKIKFTKARMVFFSNKPVKQSLFGKIFKGEIRTLVNPLFVDQLKFVPRRKGAMALGNNYVVRPNPIPRNGIAKITNAKQNIEITLT